MVKRPGGNRRKSDQALVGPVTFRSLVVGTDYALRFTSGVNFHDETLHWVYGPSGARLVKARLERVEVFSATFSVDGTRFRIDENDVPTRVANTWSGLHDERVHDHVGTLMGPRPGVMPLLAVVDGSTNFQSWGNASQNFSTGRKGARRRRRIESHDPRLVRFERVAHIDEAHAFGWEELDFQHVIPDDLRPTVGILVRTVDEPAAGELLLVLDPYRVEVATDAHLEPRNEQREAKRQQNAREQALRGFLERYGIEDLVATDALLSSHYLAHVGSRFKTSGEWTILMTPAQLAAIVNAAIEDPASAEKLLSEVALDVLGR